MSLLALALALCAAHPSDTIHASDYGVVPDTHVNATAAFRSVIDAAASRPGSVIALRPGRYDFWPDGAVRKEIFVSNTTSESEEPDKTKTFGIYFGNVNGVTLDGRGATLMMHGDITTVGIDHCNGVELKNLTIDFERPGGSEMTYTDVRPERVRVRMHPDSRYEIRNGRLYLIGEGWESQQIHCIKRDPVTREMRYSTDWQVLANSYVREIKPGELEFTTPVDFLPAKGETLTLRDIIRRNTGILNNRSTRTTLRNVNVRYMHVTGIVSQFSRDITMDHVNCRPNPKSGRVLASSADFMHFSGCSGHVEIKDCNFSGAQDDAINVHGTNLRLVEQTGTRSGRLRFMHHQTYGFEPFAPGDTVAFVATATMQRFANDQVESVRRLSDREVEVTFAHAFPPQIIDGTAGDVCVENISATPTVHISGCDIGNLSTRGILMTTPRRVIIERNRFHDLGMAAILIEADAEGWYESGPVTDVTIRDNTFINCNYSLVNQGATIAINPSNREGTALTPVHSGISITNNTFYDIERPFLYAKSTADLTFSDNNAPRPSGKKARDLRASAKRAKQSAQERKKWNNSSDDKIVTSEPEENKPKPVDRKTKDAVCKVPIILDRCDRVNIIRNSLPAHLHRPGISTRDCLSVQFRSPSF